MQDLPKNFGCVLSGTPYCEIMNTEDCKNCPLAELDREGQLLAAEDILLIAEALPENGTEDIFKGENCALCRKKREETPNEKTCYAQVDLAHKHPECEVGTMLSKHYDRGTAMTIPVQLPACNSCKTKMSMLTNLPLAIGIGIAAAGLLLVIAEPVRVWLSQRSRIIPLLVFLMFFFVAVIAECVAKKLIANKVERSMNARTRRIGALSKLAANGWFGVNEKNGVMPMIFTSERLDSGLLTGENQRELLEKIRALGKEGIKKLGKERESVSNG